MGGIRMLVGAAVACSLLAGACSAPKARDLAANPTLYGWVRYESKLPGDRSVFVTPLRDDRDASLLPASEGAFPIRYDSDTRWERPVPEMVQDVLIEEIRTSDIFESVLERAEPGALVMTPSLVKFYSATMEMMEGGRTLAEVGIRVKVYGPEESGGGRPLWLDETFADAQLSEVGLAPLPGPYLSGRALGGAMVRMLQRLDGSNVSRSGVPLEPPEPRKG